MYSSWREPLYFLVHPRNWILSVIYVFCSSAGSACTVKIRVTMVVVFCRVFVIGVHDITSLKLF